MLADNKLTDRSSWDDAALAVHLKELSELVLDFDIEAVGFELPEIDFRIQSYHFRLISSERSALATNGSQFGSGFARAALRGRCTGRRFSRRGL